LNSKIRIKYADIYFNFYIVFSLTQKLHQTQFYPNMDVLYLIILLNK